MADKKNKNIKAKKVVKEPVIAEEPKAVETPVETKEEVVNTIIEEHVETVPVEEPTVETEPIEMKVEEAKEEAAPVVENKITTPNKNGNNSYRHYYNYVWNGMMYD